MPIVISPPSQKGLRIDLYFRDQSLANASSCLVEQDGLLFLVTNWHNLTGCDPRTGAARHETLAVPDRVRVWHHAADVEHGFQQAVYPTYTDDGVPLWLEHPAYGGRVVDVVALPIPRHDGLAYFPYAAAEPEIDAATPVGTDVCVVGFPFGQTSGGAYPVWLRGMVATEPDLNYTPAYSQESLPCFLLDCRTRTGSSGSPCVFYTPGGTGILMRDGSIQMGVQAEIFLGIYSGRINEDSDLGFVWKRQAVRDIVTGGTQGATTVGADIDYAAWPL